MVSTLRILLKSSPSHFKLFFTTVKELEEKFPNLPKKGKHSLAKLSPIGEITGALIDTESEKLIAISISKTAEKQDSTWIDLRTHSDIAKGLYPDLPFDKLVRDYIDALLFISPDVDHNRPLLKSRLTKAARNAIEDRCILFLVACKAAGIDNPEVYQSKRNAKRGQSLPVLGHDLAYSSNGAGVGFWEESETNNTSKHIADEDVAGRLQRCSAVCDGLQIVRIGNGWLTYE